MGLTKIKVMLAQCEDMDEGRTEKIALLGALTFVSLDSSTCSCICSASSEETATKLLIENYLGKL